MRKREGQRRGKRGERRNRIGQRKISTTHVLNDKILLNVFCTFDFVH